MGKIKLAFVVNNLVVGGVSKVLIQLCNSLDVEKYDVHLIVLSEDLSMEEIIPLKDEVRKHCINYPFLESYSLISYLKAAFLPSQTKSRAAKVLSLIEDISPDILHFHTLPRQLIIGHLALQKDPNIKLVFTDHGVRISKDDGYRFYQKYLLLLALKKFYRGYHLVAVSKAVHHFIDQNGLKDKNVSLEMLENSLPIEHYNRSKDPNELEVQFVYVSRLNEQKGHDTLIQAWVNIKSPKKGRLLIIGPDEMHGKFHKMANNDHSIQFTGAVPNIRDYLNESTVGVFPSQKEGLPIALLEKMAMELPVITSDIPELTSIIEDNIEGIHFKLDDVNDLQKKLEYALSHQHKMRSMGLAARKKVERICKENDVVQFHDQLYYRLTKKNKSA